MKLVPSLFVISTACLFARSASAQFHLIPPGGARPDCSIKFSMPQDRDPARLTFIQPGQMYTNADSSTYSPGDNAGSVINGQLLATNGASPGNGLEVHSLIPDQPQDGVASYIPVVEVDFYTTYTGNLQIDSVVGSTFTNFIPWTVQRISVPAQVPGGPRYKQAFSFTGGQTNQALMYKGTDGYYALLTAVLADTSDPTGFNSAAFGVSGFTTVEATPEPGAFALLSGLMLGSANVLWRRRRKARR